MNTHLNVLYKKADHIARYVVRFFRNYYTVRAIRKRARLRAILLELGSRRQTYMLLFLLIKRRSLYHNISR